MSRATSVWKPDCILAIFSATLDCTKMNASYRTHWGTRVDYSVEIGSDRDSRAA